MKGQTISHYKILEKIGSGGMGVVYKALDTKLDRTVALKFLPPHLSINKEEKQRFIHEAKAAAALDHPHICNIHEIGETDDGQIFIAMGYYEGVTLKDKIACRPFPIADVIGIAIQVAEGLNKAHKKDIVHRDIKSANIIITEEGEAKILDFGLAKLRGVTKLTKEGTTLGTVAYMSPEQATGEAVDLRSDIWSLGVVLYEMIAGQLPFKGQYDQAVMYAIMNEQPEPLTALRSGVPAELERMVNKALAKNPQHRYQHMDELLADLQCLREESDKKKEPLPSPRKFSGKRVLVFSGIFLVVAILAVILGLLWLKTRSDPQPERKMLVVLPFENLGHSEDEYFTDGMHEEITTRLAMVRNLGVISRSSAMKYVNTKKTIKEIGQELRVQYILKGTVRWARSTTGPEKVRISTHLISVADDTHIWADTYDRVIDDIFQVQTDIARKVVGELNITLGENERKAVEISHTDNMEAYHAFLKAEYLIDQPHFTQKMWPEVINNYEKAVELDPEFALAWAELSRAHARLVFFQLDLSRERRERARRAAERAMELNPESPKVHLSLSYYHLWISRDTQQALKELETAEKGLPNSTSIMYAKATIYEVQGRFQDILKVMKRARELNPLSASILLKMALAYWLTREYPQAIEVAQQALALAPDGNWAHLYKVMNFWCWKGAVKEARKAIEKTQPSHSWVPYVWLWQEIGERKFQQAIDRLATSNKEWINIKIFKIPRTLAYAYLYEFMEKPQKARQYYKEAKKVLEAEIKKSPNDPRLHSSLAITLASLGEKEQAIQESKRATQILPISKDAVYGIPYFHELALTYTIIGDYEAALDQIEYLLSIPSTVSPAWLSLDPRWDRLKKLPRYQQIMQEYKKREKY
jgi:serine/threonine protein kinase/tetratricopeptide (TPR) repeat protein